MPPNSRADASHILPRGECVAHYQIRVLAGRGASADVYEAIDMRRGDRVALKLLRPKPATDAEAARDALRRFQQEAALAMALQHPDIVRTLEAGTLGHRAWLAMEWVAGHELTRYTAPQRLLPELVVLELTQRLARALDHAHRQGMLHRDVKPSNVRIHLPAHTVKLGDFGAARAGDSIDTRTGVIVGTPAYMAPEQLAGEPASKGSDLYSLAVVAFELFCGRRPYAAPSMGELLRQVMSEPAPSLRNLRPQIPAALDRLMTAALAKQAVDRPPDGRSFAQALESVRDEVAAAAQALPAAQRG